MIIKKIIKKKDKKEYKIILLHGSILFITFIVKHQKLMQFIVPHKLFRVILYIVARPASLFKSLYLMNIFK